MIFFRPLHTNVVVFFYAKRVLRLLNKGKLDNKNINSTLALMKAITQEHGFGCGIASIAFILGITYKDASTLFNDQETNSKGLYCKDLIKILGSFGLDYQYRYLKPRYKRKIYIKGTIVFIKRSKDFPNGHYLVRGEGYWMDSWINFKIDKNINNAISGFRKRLPGEPIYLIFSNSGV